MKIPINHRIQFRDAGMEVCRAVSRDRDYYEWITGPSTDILNTNPQLRLLKQEIKSELRRSTYTQFDN